MGALLRRGDRRLPNGVMSGELENAEKRGPRGEKKEWTDCVAEDSQVFGITGDWSIAALDCGVWYSTVCKECCRPIAAWVREEKKASENLQRKREAEEAGKVEVARGTSVGSLRWFRTTLIGPTQGLAKRCRLRRQGSLKTLRIRCSKCYAFR